MRLSLEEQFYADRPAVADSTDEDLEDSASSTTTSSSLPSGFSKAFWVRRSRRHLSDTSPRLHPSTPGLAAAKWDSGSMPKRLVSALLGSPRPSGCAAAIPAERLIEG